MILRALSVLWTSFAPPMANHLWQSTLFVVLAAILAFALRKNQGRVRYWVWLTASMKFLIPFSLLIALGSHLAKPRPSTPAQAVVYSTVEDFSQPFAAPDLPPLSQAPAPVSRFHLLPPIVVALWLAGIIAVLMVWATGWIRVSRMVRRAVPLHQGPEVEALRRLKSSVGIGKPIRLVLSPNWMEPGIFGIFRPVLLWPEGISHHLNDRHIDAILAHEICHARRHDNLTAMLHMLVEAIFWFHPLVWWMGARLEEERERACDEEVSLLCHQPHVYAESILRVCKFCSESPLACVSGITGADLKKRIMQIMTVQTGRELDLSRKLILCVATVMAVALPVTFGLVHATQVRAQSVPAQGTGATPIKPMAADARPSFAVATIKPHDPASNSQGFHNAGERISIRNESITSLMMFAYSINKHQGINLPAWAETSSYDIEGKTDTPGEPNLRQQQEMIQNLLADRFHLKIHREQRELPVYAIQVAKGGAKLKPAAKPEDQPNQQGNSHGPEMTQTYTNCSIPNFILGMQFFLDRPVVDQTGLTGHYDFTFRYTADEVHATDPNAPPGLFTAVQEQLGLKFEPTKAHVAVFVIDHVEKPTVDGAEVAPVAGPRPITQVPAAPVLVGQAQEKPVAQSDQPVKPMARTADPAFEVAVIKPSDPNDRSQRFSLDGHRIHVENNTMTSILCFAYSIQSTQIVNAPSWFDEQRWDIDGVPDVEGAPSWPQYRRMLQKLLASRFGLQLHPDKRELSVYALTVAKGGPKLEKSKSDPDALSDSSGNGRGSAQYMKFTNVGMADLAQTIELMGVDRPVVDQTNLSGRYDFSLLWTPDPLRATESDAAPGLFTAVQEQLGLKLDAVKAPADVFVIDHVERPSEN